MSVMAAREALMCWITGDEELAYWTTGDEESPEAGGPERHRETPWVTVVAVTWSGCEHGVGCGGKRPAGSEGGSSSRGFR